MSSMPLLGSKPPRTPYVFSSLSLSCLSVSLSKKFQNQNNLAYWASEKSRLRKVEEVGSFETFKLPKTTHLSSGDKCCHLTMCFRLMEPNYVEPLPGKARCFEFRSVDSTSRTEVDYPLVDGLTIEATFIKDSSVWSDRSFVNKWSLRCWWDAWAERPYS